MNRNSKENKRTNTVFVIGEIERVKLNAAEKLKRVSLNHSTLLKNTKTDSVTNPLKVFTQGNALVVIDDNEEGWLVSEPFEGAVNLSSLIKNRITNVYLGEKELIAQTKKGNILINWGAKKLIEKPYLSKLNTFGTSDYDSFFQVFIITNSFSADFYLYSPEKKVQNLNRLYFINQLQRQIIGYPTGLTINTKKAIRGLSVGKFYTLCWDQEGKLYSWGSKSLGLGYGQIPTEEFIQNPQMVKLSKNVITAFADCHYSLALTDEGVIYQWGIKRDINQINEEPIFKPKPLQFRYYKCNAKFVALKGKDSNYAVLSSQGQLYVWGNTARNLLNPRIVLPSTWKKAYIYQPVLQTDLLKYHICDFSIENGFLAVVAGNDDQTVGGNQQYWNVLITKAKKQLSLFKMFKVNTESEEVTKLKRKYKNSILSCDSKTERVKCNRSKGDYLRMTMIDDAPRLVTKNLSQETSPFSAQFYKRSAPTTSTTFLPLTTPKLHKRQASEVPTKLVQIKSNDKFRTSEANPGVERLGTMFRRGSQLNLIYNKKWQQILQKRRMQQKAAKESNIKQLQQENEGKQTPDLVNEQNTKILKKTLQQHLITAYLGNSFKFILEQVKKTKKQIMGDSEIKIDCPQVEITLTQAIIQKIESLKCKYFIRHTILMMCFRKYVKAFRKRKYAKQRVTAVSSIVKLPLIRKVSLAIEKLRKKTSKISKLTEWIAFYNRQQLKCLKQVWNNFVIFTFKLKDGGEFNFTHPNPDLTFKQYFSQRKIVLPCLKLERYMRIKYPQLSTTSLKLRRTMNGELRRKGLKTEKISLTLEVLPFSLHYNYFRKPKNLDINVGEVHRTHSSWVQLQKKTLDQYLKQTLFEYSRQYYTRKKEYDVEMGNFIATYYQTFYEKRWKFIIQYNKLEKSAYKKKKEAELKRLLKLVNMTKLFQEDCIPQKHIVLEEAVRRKDSPVAPELLFQFDLEVFQKNYKSYVQVLHSKIKTLKKKTK